MIDSKGAAAYASITASSSIGVVLFDRTGLISSRNSAFERMIGGSPNELSELLPALVATQLLDLSTTQSSRVAEVTCQKTDGPATVLLMAALVNPAPDGGGVCLFLESAAYGSTRDRERAGRMAAIGKLAAGVAHEINNPLAYAMGNLSFAIESLQGPPNSMPDMVIILAALRDALDGTERVRRTIRDLKTFARPESDWVGPVDVERVMRAAASLAATEIRHRARLVCDFEPVPLARANESKLAQVFLSLLINAAHSIPDGDVEDNEIRVAVRREGERIAIEVKDTGVGLDADALRDVFDPFSESRATVEGAGLGLAICHRIVHECGGEIAAESVTGKGSTFTVSLLISREALESTRTPSRIEPRQRARVLVVDDEPRIGGAITRILTPVHDVTAVCSAKEAIQRLEGGEDYDIILCDVMMPQMNGRDLYEALDRSIPHMVHRIVFMTGGPFSSRGSAFLENTPNLRLEKPFSPEALRTLVQKALR